MNAKQLFANLARALVLAPALAILPGRAACAQPADPAISYTDTSSHLWVMNADGSNQKKIVAAPTTGGSFSPDGKKLVYERPNVGIFTINADGTSAVKILSLTYNFLWGAEWSPGPSVDGREKIAFTAKMPGVLAPTTSSLCIMNTDGTGLTVLTDRYSGGYSPTWNPTSNRIALYGHNARPAPEGFSNKVYAVDLVLQGTAIVATNRTILNASGPLAGGIGSMWEPNWGPNNEILVSAQVAGSSYEVWRFPVGNPDAAVRLTTNSVSDFQAVWNFDATQVLFATDAFSPRTIVRTDPWGQNMQRLFPVERLGEPAELPAILMRVLG